MPHHADLEDKTPADSADGTALESPNSGKVAVITGASSGIGRATALEFARQGFHVVLAARRQRELEAVAASCRQYGIQAVVQPTDTTD